MEFACRELQIEPTNKCNLNCSICSHGLFGVSQEKDLTLSEFRSILDKFQDIESVFLQGLGEPFLNLQLSEMISFASQRKLFVYTTTNANALDQKIIQNMISSKLNELRISIDTFDDALYERIKIGGSLRNAIDAIKLINQKKKEYGVSYPVLRLNMVLMKETAPGILKLIDMAASLGMVEVSLIPLVLHGKGMATEEHNVSVLVANEISGLILQAEELAKKRGIDLVSGISTERHPDALAIKQFIIPKCYHSMYIQSNGDLSPCCNIPLRFGNILKEELEDIVCGKKMRRLRNFLQQTKPSCHDCVNFAYNL
jgi:MoaA/NifB/PqqE/SkfB family radical SAM enzyme